MIVSALATILGGYRYRFRDEKSLQAEVERVLTMRGVPFEREAVIGDGERVDFLVAGIGVELKVRGNANDVLRQLGRYAECQSVQSLILLSPSHRLCAEVPTTLCGKTVKAVHLWASAFG